MRHERGQGIVEFAMLFPFLFLFVFLPFTYIALWTMDYIALSNLARESARTACVTPGDDYAKVQAFYAKNPPALFLCKWDGAGGGLAIANEQDKEGKTRRVMTEVKASLGGEGTAGGVLRNVLGDGIADKMAIDITYYMHKEDR